MLGVQRFSTPEAPILQDGAACVNHLNSSNVSSIPIAGASSFSLCQRRRFLHVPRSQLRPDCSTLPLFLLFKIFLHPLPCNLNHILVLNRRRHIDLLCIFTLHTVLHQLSQTPPQSLSRPRPWDHTTTLNHPTKCSNRPDLLPDEVVDLLE